MNDLNNVNPQIIHVYWRSAKLFSRSTIPGNSYCWESGPVIIDNRNYDSRGDRASHYPSKPPSCTDCSGSSGYSTYPHIRINQSNTIVPQHRTHCHGNSWPESCGTTNINQVHSVQERLKTRAIVRATPTVHRIIKIRVEGAGPSEEQLPF